MFGTFLFFQPLLLLLARDLDLRRILERERERDEEELPGVHIYSLETVKKKKQLRYLDGILVVGLGDIRDALRGAAAAVRANVHHSQRSDQSSNKC